jgi:Protein of unknown function (DUF3592)
VFGSHKKLYEEGTQAEGVVVKSGRESPQQWHLHVTVRVKFPDGTTAEFKKGGLVASDVGTLYEGSIVPIRYDPSDYSKVALDVPALKARQDQVKSAQQAQLDAEVANLGQPGGQTVGGPPVQVISGIDDLGALKAQILQAAAQNPGRGRQLVVVAASWIRPGSRRSTSQARCAEAAGPAQR